MKSSKIVFFCQIALLSLTSMAHAESIKVTVLSNDGEPLSQAVIEFIPTSAGAKQQAASSQPKNAIMAQRNKQFDPHIVAVQKGGKIDFPNEDSISHQVYSLSDIQQFELFVEQGQSMESPVFQTSGSMSIGCNIHDWMLAYIYVSESPYFTTTGEDGSVNIDLPAGESFDWRVWHPRIDSSETANKGSMSAPTGLTVQLSTALLPSYDESEDFDDFDDY